MKQTTRTSFVSMYSKKGLNQLSQVWTPSFVPNQPAQRGRLGDHQRLATLPGVSGEEGRPVVVLPAEQRDGEPVHVVVAGVGHPDLLHALPRRRVPDECDVPGPLPAEPIDDVAEGELVRLGL